MKTVVIEGIKKLAVRDVPVPKAYDQFAVVRIHAAPMCTEYRKYLNGTETFQLGHEAAGEVVETGRSGRVKPGDRVIVMPQFSCGVCELCSAGEYIHCEQLIDPIAADGKQYGTATYAEYMLKADYLLIPIPDELSYVEASMACCGLGPAFGAAKNMRVAPGDVVLITGLGPVGLGGIIDSTYRGAKVIGASKNAYRTKLAIALGADAVVDPSEGKAWEKIMELTGGKGVDKVIECTGETAYQQLAFRAVRRKGQIAFVGESERLCLDVSNDLLRKGLTLHGIWHWNLNHAPEMIDLIRGSRDKISKLITHVFPLDRTEEAFQLQATGNCGKVVLKP